MDIRDNVCNIAFSEVAQKIKEYEYALIYSISEALFDRTEKISEVVWDEVKEAYFFGEQGQMHVYEDDGELKAVVFTETAGMKYVDRKYELAGKYKGVASNVIRREYIASDEDGQIYVAYTRLVTTE